MIGKYILYLWKKTNKLVFIGLLVAVLLYPVLILVSGEPELRYFGYWSESVDEWIRTQYCYFASQDTLLYMMTIVGMGAAYLVPIIVQANFQNKKRCDNLYALPMRKSVQILTTSLYGLVTLLLVWWLTALIGLGASFIVHLRYTVSYFFLYCLVMTALMIGVYGVTTLFASLANSRLDSVLLVGISMLIPVAFNVCGITESLRAENSVLWLFTSPIYAADAYTCFFQEQVAYCSPALQEFLQSLETTGGSVFYDYTFGAAEIGSLAAYFALGLIGYGASFLLWRKVRSEEAGTPSAKWYSYPLVFSVLMVFLFYSFSPFHDWQDAEMYLLNAIFIVAYFVAMFVFRRKIGFTRTNLIAFAITIVTGNLLAIFPG
ncbi:MAG: hypothetical protein ACI4U2_04440 [Christensenellaceae bacterium]